MLPEACSRIHAVVGAVFGDWTVINTAPNRDGRRAVLCRCACGTERSVVVKSLRRGISRSCGHDRGKPLTAFKQAHARFIPVAGARYGRLVLTGRTELRARGLVNDRSVEALCDCGRTSWHTWPNVYNGNTRSCGCLHREAASARFRTHGHAVVFAKRGQEYRSWRSMVCRCYYPSNVSYKYYGERGITICDEWRRDFPAFLAYIGPCPGPGFTVDRIDPDGHYEPGNVRWADKKTQARNTRKNKAKSQLGER